MRLGDIVKLKKEHYLSEIFDVNCIVYEKVNFQKITRRKPRYHIKTMTGELKWVWVYESEVDMISDIRSQKLEELGI
jgi:hypothetical protein